MSKCTIPGCDGDVIQEFKIGGRTIRQSDLPSPYDTQAVSKFKKKHGGKSFSSVYYCGKCRVMYHHPPKDLEKSEAPLVKIKNTN